MLKGCLVLFFCAIAYGQLCPALGVSCVEPASLSYSTDFGNNARTTARFVAQPTNASEVQKVVHYARLNNIPIAVRGNGHSSAGQTLTTGILIDTSRLTAFEPSNTLTTVKLGAGFKWEDASFLVNQAVPTKRLAFAPDTVSELNVGGLVSIGGLRAFSLKAGTLIDYITEVEVVTGKGEILICNPSQNPDLFRAVRGGLGQYAVIVSVTMKLVDVPSFAGTDGIPAETKVLSDYCGLYTPTEQAGAFFRPGISLISFITLWTDPGSFYDDLGKMTKNSNVDGIETFFVPNSLDLAPLLQALFTPQIITCLTAQGILGNSQFPYLYFGVIPDVAPFANFSGFSSDFRILQALPLTWFEYENRQKPFTQLADFIPFWNNPKYSWNLFLPFNLESRTWFVNLMKFVLPAKSFLNPNAFFVLDVRALSGFARNNLFVQPKIGATDFYFHTYISAFINVCPFTDTNGVRTYSAECESTRSTLKTFLQGLYDIVLLKYATFAPTFYPTGFAPYSWSRHYGAQWTNVTKLKCQYDPKKILGGSVGVFSTTKCPANSRATETDSLEYSSSTTSTSPATVGIIVGVAVLVVVAVIVALVTFFLKKSDNTDASVSTANIDKVVSADDNE